MVNVVQKGIRATVVQTPIQVGITAVSLFSTAQQTVNSTAGQLDSSVGQVGVIIKALSTNTGKVYVGNSASVSSTNGFELSTSEAVSIDVNNANLIWLIASIDGQKVCVVVV